MDQKVEQGLAASSARIVVTGAGGWLGMATLELLKSALGGQFKTRVVCFGSSTRTLRLLDGTEIVQRPLADLALLERVPTILLHLAFLTKDRAEAMEAGDYEAACQQLSGSVLEALDRIGAERIFLASSGAAAFAEDPSASDAMRLYGRLKRKDEEAFAAWAERSGNRAVIARIFNLSGPHINKHQSYALASFILDGLAGRPVSVQAVRRVVRGYVAIRELMSLVFALLLEKTSGVVRFDSGGEPMEMQAIAQTVVQVVGGPAVHRPALGDSPADEYVGDDATYRQLLAEQRVQPVPFTQQVIETAQYLGAEMIEL